MADLVQDLLYGIFFSDPVKGAAAQAANGGSLQREIPPEAALAQYAPDAVILQLSPYLFTNVPGAFDAGSAYNPRLITTDADKTVDGGLPGRTTLFHWSGTLIFSTPSVPAPSIIPDPQAITGSFDLQVLTYTGDGTSNRQIATDFPLDVGRVAVWVMGGVGAGAPLDLNCFRSTAMTAGTFVCGSSGYQPSQGIMTLNGAGFTVTPGNIAGLGFANATGQKYTAVILRDTTSDNHYLQLDIYDGLGSFLLDMTTTEAGASESPVIGAFQPAYNGLTFINGGTGIGHVLEVLDATHGIIRPGEGTIGFNLYSYNGDDRPILVGPAAPDLTHCWIWGRGTTYRSVEFGFDESVALAFEAYPTSDSIEDLIAAVPPSFPNPQILLGTQNNVNSNGLHYSYMTLRLDPVLASRHLFASQRGTGNGGAVVTGFGFTPAVAFGKWFIANNGTTGGIWRGPDHTGLHSSWCGKTSGALDLASTGIRSLDTDGVTVGSDVAHGTDTFYVWAFKGGPSGGPGTTTIPFDPTYIPTGPGPGQPPACPVVFTQAGGSQPSACAETDFS